MASTTNTKVTKNEGWKAVISAGSGVFSASFTCTYLVAESEPAENIYGHRLNGGDEIDFLIDTNEQIYFKTQSEVTIVVTGESEL